MSKAPLTICFDLDGTLVDTASDLIAALDHALSTKGYSNSNPAIIRPIIGEGARAMIITALEHQSINLAPSRFTPSKVDKLWHIMIEHYTTHISVHSRPYDGALPAITTLKQQGHKLAICTNKSLALTTPLLTDLKLDCLFDAITAGDSFAFKKPDPNHIFETIKLSGGIESNAIMIGDSNADILAARNAGIPVIGVEWGYTKIPIKDLNPDITISHFNELHAAIETLR